MLKLLLVPANFSVGFLDVETVQENAGASAGASADSSASSSGFQASSQASASVRDTAGVFRA